MTPAPIRVAIACQGGGSHTAFTAGVLSRLLSSPELAGREVVGISGTSGGAICATVAWAALRDGRRHEAGARLKEFWADNSARWPLDKLLNATLVSTALWQSLGLLPSVSPYLVPRWIDGSGAFTRLLRKHIDFDALGVDPDGVEPMLALGAVDVVSGRFRAFCNRRERITPDMVLASAAIPQLFKAVHIGDGAYWDGLFSQNPPTADLLEAAPDELWVIQINPSESREPRSVLDIADRRNELAGNISLYQELNSIERVDQLLESGMLSPGAGYKKVTVRVIELSRSVLPRWLGSASKTDRSPRFLRRLIAHGEERADRFLAALRFEQAWRDGDLGAVGSMFTDDAELVSSYPFPRSSTDLRAYVARWFDGPITIDSNRKQIAGDDVTWTVQLPAGEDRPITYGRATATFDGDRVSALHLGPVG